jgi:hypothetical protein
MHKGHAVHYEEFFLTGVKPTRVVFWGFTEEEGWVERVEHTIN